MKPRLAVAAVAALIPVVLAGCSAAGKPTGSASAGRSSAPAAQPPPAVGACYLKVRAVSYPATDLPLDCAKTHRTETIAVGDFTDEYARTPAPPPAGSGALRWAFHACDLESQRFVGGDWRGGRLSVQVVVPAPDSWAAGSHWYRCDIFELVTLDGGTAREHPDDQAVERTGSLRDALTRRLPLLYTCFNDDQWEQYVPVLCTKPHHFEFVGIWTAPEIARAKIENDDHRIWAGCLRVIADYIGAPELVSLEPQTGIDYRLPSLEAWERGDRGVRCFLWAETQQLTRSLKGAGPKVLPIQ